MFEARLYYEGMAGEGSKWPEKTALQSLKTLVTTHQTTVSLPRIRGSSYFT
jgi:hypothetical protein